MLSEYASAQAGQANRNGQSTLPALGFEQGYGGQSYGLEELVQRDPPFSIGRVQYPLQSSLLSLACSSNILVLVVAGNTPSSPPRLIRIDLAVPENERSVELVNVVVNSSTAAVASSTSSSANSPASSRPGTSGQQQHRAQEGKAGAGNTYRLFLDPSGRHALVSTSVGETYYFYSGWDVNTRRARLLPKLRGIAITAVAWNSPLAQSSSQNAQSTSSTKEILLGDSNGNIYECVLDGSSGSGEEVGNAAAAALRSLSRSGNAERYFKLVHSISDNKTTASNKARLGEVTITGLKAEIWASTSSAQNRRRAAVLVTTSSRLYQFMGSVPVSAANASSVERDEGGMYDDFFRLYRDTLPKSLELPGDGEHSELHFWEAAKDKVLLPPRKVAWMTGPGIYSGALSYSSQEPGDGIIDSAQLVPYPANVEATHYDDSPHTAPQRQQQNTASMTPISMATTEHHFILLYSGRLRVLRGLDDQVVYDEDLDIPEGETVRSLATDSVNKTYWLYTDASIFEISVKDEDQDLWRVYLAKQAFDTALKHSKTAQQRSTINAAQGDAFYSSGRYIQSAEAYAQSNKSFEEVVLRFTDKEERDALRYYLVRCLERLKKNDLTQRIMLATWLVEIYLSKINHLEDIAASESASDDVENYRAERIIIEDDLKQFLQQYRDNLDKTTIFDLIASHGRSEMLLHYASVVGDYNRIVAHWIGEEDWQSALLALARQSSLLPYYRYAPVLMRNAPKETVDSFLRQSALQSRLLIPALVQPNRRQSGNHIQQSIRYLEHAIFNSHNIDPAVHNALLTLLALPRSSSDTKEHEDDLLHFLQTAPVNDETGKPYFDLDYALRICKMNKQIRASVEIYTKMELYEASVELALQHGDVELAKYNADLPLDDDLQRKKLWLQIAKHVVQEKNDLKTAMQFLESTTLLKIEDILPFFPDFTTIDDFKEDICDALEEYGHQIERLKAEMSNATDAAEAIKRDIADLRNRFVVVDSAAKCDSCGGQLLARQFYVFPCQHAFHADCLIREVTQHLPSHSLRRVIDLQNQIAKEVKENDEKVAQFSGATGGTSDLLGLESLGLVSGRKLAQASVQGLDSLRKLVIPDALVTVVGGGILGAVGRDNRLQAAKQSSREVTNGARKSKQERLREELDDLLASSCVFCDTAVSSLDRPFLAQDEMDL